MLDKIATFPQKINFTLDIYALSEDDTMGIRIMKLRQSKNLIAKELGEQIGITAKGIINYENGNAYPSRDVLLKLIDTLGEDVLCDDYSKFITTDYGPLINQWRKNNNFTCEQAANYIGVSTRTLYSIENVEYILGRKRFEIYKTKLIEIVLNN